MLEPKWPTQSEHYGRSLARFLNSVASKQLGVLLLLPEWDASPSQSYPQQYIAHTHLYTWVKTENMEQSLV